MKTLKDLELHSIYSLGRRFNWLVSRTTLGKWMKSGRLKPVLQSRNSNNSHLLFRKGDLDKVQAELEGNYRERMKRLAKRAAGAVRFREQAHEEALRQAGPR